MKLATIPKKVEPQEGDYKIERRFAWWPRNVEDKKIWLEYYKVVRVYTVRERIAYIIKGPMLKLTCGGWDFVTEQLIKK